MLKTSTKNERRTKLKGLTSIAVIPIYLQFVDGAFFNMYTAVFGDPAGTAAARHGFSVMLTSGRFLSAGLMTLLMYLWVRPAILYPADPRPRYLETMRRRIGNLYRDAGIMLGAALTARLLLLFFSGTAGGALTQVLPALLVSYVAQACALLIYVDFNFSMNQDFMELLFTREELYSPRRGGYVPLYVKVGGLVFSFALLPFVFVYAALHKSIAADSLVEPASSLLFLSAITLFVGLRFVFHGIQKPLNGLIDKMRRVSEGDFDVKTRVYFSDEVARLKAGFNEMVDGLKERAELQDTFGKYMSIEIARELIKNKKVNLGGEDMEAAVMFCDIRNFTSLSEKMSASMLVEFLNGYFHYITPPIAAHHGVISKFMGDAVMAIYTPLMGSGDYAADAVRAAVDMRKALSEYNDSGKLHGRVEFGIGVHCGKLVAGNIGTAARLEYTFIGDTVNIASRLESKTKDFNTDIIVSEAAVVKASGSLGGSVAFEPLGKAALKGKSEMMELYKVAN